MLHADDDVGATELVGELARPEQHHLGETPERRRQLARLPDQFVGSLGNLPRGVLGEHHHVPAHGVARPFTRPRARRSSTI